jgi:rSAM/selenodomain-associated transferase 2/rSAM/selenodomain-associated transferase 1
MMTLLTAEAAAHLQRQMTGYTLAQARQLMRQEEVSVEVRFSGGSGALMQEWLGQGVEYQPQGEGDLGARMASAFRSAFEAGADRVVTIGTDCPGVDAAYLEVAFQQLENSDLVLGPASDGGYTLIGLRRSLPELFTGVDWGTDAVFRQTMAIAHTLNLSIHCLEPLTDVDRPEDLPVWEKVQQQTLSVIVPVLNEEAQMERLFTMVQPSPFVELVLVDGGSRDNTVALARSGGATVLTCSPGRAQQQNAGAAIARGGTLLFLHADTQLPPDFVEQIEKTLAQPNVVAGAFQLQIDGSQPGLRLVEWGVNVRSRLFQLPYGDQALFLKSETFQQSGGFPALPIMEDFVLVRQLQKLGRVGIAPAAVTTSARRWEKLGVLQTTLTNQLIIAGYFLGVPVEQLARLYRKK